MPRVADLMQVEFTPNQAKHIGDGQFYDESSGLSVNVLDLKQWTNWIPTLTGFSADPTNTVYRYIKIGKICWLSIRQGANGTSNATTFTISLPFTAATITNMIWMVSTAAIVNNGATPTTPGMAQIVSAASVMDLFIDQNNGAWTNVNGKRVKGLEIWYETV